MSTRTLSWQAAMMAVLTLAATAVKADFTLVSQNLTIDRQDHIADFSLTFNQAPDFFTLDSFGRPVDSFQYNFNGNFQVGGGQEFPNNLTAIVRGDEIHLGDGIRIRNPNGDGGPDSGGWGPVIASVPYRLIGNNISFSVPTADLGYTGRYYQYEVFSLQDGAATADHNITVVPLPSAFWSGLVGMPLAGIAGMWMRRAMVKAQS